MFRLLRLPFISANRTAMALALSAALNASAALVAYQEGASGDLAESVPSATIFALGAGSNTIAGTFAAGGDFDSFAIEIGAGERLTSVVLSIGDIAGGVFRGGYYLCPANSVCGPTDLGYTTYTDDIGSKSMFTTALPLGPGTYGVVDGDGHTFANFPDLSFSEVSYQWTFNVEQTVPEPSSLALISLAALGLLATTPRKRQS